MSGVGEDRTQRPPVRQPRLRLRIASGRWRARANTTVGSGAGLLTGLVLSITQEELDWILIVLVASVASSAVYVAALVWTFGTLPSEGLAEVVRREGTRRRSWWHAVTRAEGAWGTVAYAVIALVAAGIVVVERPGPVIAVLATATVVVTWVGAMVGHAVDYAEHVLVRGGLEVDGGPTDDADRLYFADYLQLSLSVAVLAGPVGYRVTSRAMRTLVTTQAALSFVFNTVVVALLVSALVGS